MAENRKLYAVQLACGHFLLYRGLVATPYMDEVIICAKCPTVNDKFQTYKVVTSPKHYLPHQAICNQCNWKRTFRSSKLYAEMQASRHAQLNSHRVELVRGGSIVKAFDWTQQQLENSSEPPF